MRNIELLKNLNNIWYLHFPVKYLLLLTIKSLIFRGKQ
jgi:hypothetical protein